ncbi:hypothetical protein SEEGA711_10127 [Salmonella enterica subsp. enterica serovar Gaminara str. ATCC BAA-711]|nr:hypothetical protein SEEGA711_10127 [Salmonella enterica subsp. enterica serovar Gaminara str. ATCC BAA-711]
MVNLRNHIFRDTGRCRASIPVGRSVGDTRAQGKPQPDAHGRRELEGETVKPERANDRKIAADVKEGPGDRSGASEPLYRRQPDYDGCTAQPAHDTGLTEWKTTRPRHAGTGPP